MNERLRAYKESMLRQAAKRRQELDHQPVLRNLFFEFTTRCNENCFHCGSKCGADAQVKELTASDWIAVTDEVKAEFDPLPMLCITGGEPLLYGDFFSVMEHAADQGFLWGMTTNATLIDASCAKRLKKSGMRTVSVSIDGLPETHDRLRGTSGGYERAMKGLQCLIAEGFDHVQVTTVINHENISELDSLFEIMNGLDIDSWRVINLEPIGRALDYPERMLTSEDYVRIFDFIREKRAQQYPVCYGCAHYLGPEYERDVRDWYFMCTAGRTTASIMSDGSVGACLDIERNEKTVQGNIHDKPFTKVWKEDFGIFRQSLSNLCEGCSGCAHEEFCAGGACHSFDYKNGVQRMCFKGYRQISV